MDASSIYILKSRLAYIRDSRMASSWTSPLSPRPHWLVDLLVGLHKVNHKVNQLHFDCLCLVGSLTTLFCLCLMLMQYITPDRLTLELCPEHERPVTLG